MMQKPAIYRLVFKSQYHMTASLMRMQEYYEGPKLAGDTFSVEQCFDDYAARNNDEMSYFTAWAGFNFPDYVAYDVLHLYDFQPLTRKEQAVGEAIAEYLRHDPCYFISADPADKGDAVLLHEVVHGLYYLNPEYQLEVDDAVASDKGSKTFAKMLRSTGYGPNVISDETNAYVLTGLGHYHTPKLRKQLAPLRRTLLDIFAEHFNGIRLTTPAGRKQVCRMVRKTIRIKPPCY